MIMSVPSTMTRRPCIRCGRVGATHIWFLDASKPHASRTATPALRLALPEVETEASPGSADSPPPAADNAGPRTRRIPWPEPAAAGSELTVTRVSEILDWLENLHRDGRLNETAYKREVRRVVAAALSQLKAREQ
jgi:hypothetical protein